MFNDFIKKQAINSLFDRAIERVTDNEKGAFIFKISRKDNGTLFVQYADKKQLFEREINTGNTKELENFVNEIRLKFNLN